MSVPWVYVYVRDRTGQSTTIGMVLIISITMVGTGLVVSLGADAVNETERVTALSQAEQAMAQLDSRMAKVTLVAPQPSR